MFLVIRYNKYLVLHGTESSSVNCGIGVGVGVRPTTQIRIYTRPDHTNFKNSGVQLYNYKTPMSKLTPFVPHSVSVIVVAHLEASLTHDYVYFAGKRVTRLAPGPPQNHAKNSRKKSFLAHSNGDSVSSAYAGRCSLATTATMAWLT